MMPVSPHTASILQVEGKEEERREERKEGGRGEELGLEGRQAWIETSSRVEITERFSRKIPNIKIII